MLLFHTAFATFRIDISDKGIALRASSKVQDTRIVTVEEMNLIINKDKVSWQKKKL